MPLPTRNLSFMKTPNMRQRDKARSNGARSAPVLREGEILEHESARAQINMAKPTPADWEF